VPKFRIRGCSEAPRRGPGLPAESLEGPNVVPAVVEPAGFPASPRGYMESYIRSGYLRRHSFAVRSNHRSWRTMQRTIPSRQALCECQLAMYRRRVVCEEGPAEAVVPALKAEARLALVKRFGGTVQDERMLDSVRGEGALGQAQSN
jgi:hypothetical protein